MAAGGDRRVLVGRVVGVYGVQGAIKIESWTEPRMQIFRYQPWYLKTASGNEIEVDGCRGREQGKGMIAELPGHDDREKAAALIGTEIWVSRSALPKPKPGEYYWTDLEGLDVVTVDGVALGRVSHLFSTGANDVLVARDGERERMIPWVLEQYVREVDLDANRIVVDWDPDF
ncbi:MAG TPA: ribosome maturation factor RimM [Tahibacter sp.]|nr:ribosome maturation factor RimM [Tahibacter sp.]